jgi:hypothetical protein
MRPALCVLAVTALAIAIPSVSQAGTICSDCPEPATGLLTALGVMALAIGRRRA